MTLDFDARYYSYDAVQAEFSFDTDDDGVTTDNRGAEDGRTQSDSSSLSEPSTDKGSEVWWDAQRSVSADDVPSYYNDFFDADRYYSIDTVVAKSIPQQYTIDDEEYTFIKPNDELRQAAWSLDGRPWTITHPSEGAVRSTDEIHGFWGQPRHNDDTQESWTTLYFPTTDDEGRAYVAENDNVSVGFINTLVASDRDGIDAEQTDLYYDHVASVKKGRCSDEDGCGLQGFANGTDSRDYASASAIEVSDMRGATSISHLDADTDVTDSGSNTTDNDKTMTCNDCQDGTNDGLNLDVGDFGVSKIRTENDAIDDELSTKEDRISDLEDEVDANDSAKELLSAASDSLDADDGDELLTAIETLQDDYEEVREEMESYRTDERDDLLEEVTSLADDSAHKRFEQREDESVTDHIDRLEDSLELMQSVKSDSSPTNITPDRRTDSTSGESEFDSTTGAEVDASQFADVEF